MRYTKGPGDIIEVTLNQSSVTRLAMKMYICCKLLHDVDFIARYRKVMISKLKEVMSVQVNDEEKNRKRLKTVLRLCINTLNLENRHERVVNF